MPRSLPSIAFVVVSIAGCGEAAPWSRCDEAAVAAADGDPCSGFGECGAVDPEDRDCMRIVECELGYVTSHRSCVPRPCTSIDDCDPGQFCESHPFTCGTSGWCRDRPLDCPDRCSGVCGCDGVTYCNECVAWQAGVAVERRCSCDRLECPLPCAAQEANSSGECMTSLGVRWNGEACEEILGCSCEGADCGGLYESSEQCEIVRRDCLPED